MFIDASAAVSLLATEPTAEQIARRIDAAETEFFYSAISYWETVVAIARIYSYPKETAMLQVDRLFQAVKAQCMEINRDISLTALAAHTKYGKGSGHPARLNMGDCFAYACAKSLKLPLLYVGDDFSHTDLALELK